MLTGKETTEKTVNEHGNMGSPSAAWKIGWLSQHTGHFQRKPEHFQGTEKSKVG